MTTSKTVSEAVRAKAVDNLRKAKVQMLLHQPFFANIFLRRTTKFDDNIDTAMVDRKGRITLGTEFASKLSVPQMVFLLAHESMHFAMMHHDRQGYREKKMWNEACDNVINDILENANVGQKIDACGSSHPGGKDMTAEEMYEILKKANPDKGKSKGGGQGYAPPQAGTGSNDLSDGSSGEELSEEEKENIKQELLQAQSAAKAVGKMPASIEGMISALVNPPTPWHQLLERFMLNEVKTGVSFRRPNKRFMCQDLYLPSVDKLPHLGTVVIQVDESGSIGKEELAHFSGHINRILETCNPERVVVLHTDTRVAKVEEFATEDLPLTLKSYAGGGTDMEVGFDYTEQELGIEPDVFITLTDMYTPFSKKYPPAYPVVWLSTTKDIVAPYGETIYYEITRH